MKIIPTLDKIYARTLDADATPDERRTVYSAMEHVVSKCDEWLTTPGSISSPERRMAFNRLRKMSADTLNEIEVGHDVLQHWVLQRELLQKLFR